MMFPPDEVLWCLNTHVAHKLPSGGFAPHPRVNIAHTVVLRQGILAAWFFTSIKDGSVKKKKRPNLIISNVIDHFCRHRLPEMADMPVAFFVAYESEKTHDPVRSIKYIMANELEDFLRPVNESAAAEITGFLQQWTHPASSNNYLVHCLWSPSAIQIRKRFAKKSFSARGQLYQKLVTFEGDECDSELVDCSASLQKDIREQAATIAGHISRAKSSPIESMTTYWKVDRNQKLFLIMCSHASFRSNVAVNRLCSPSLKVPVEAPYDHLNKAPTSLDELLPRCQLCARTCGSVHAPPSNAPQIPPSTINRAFSHVKAESSNCSLQANAAGLQVLQVDSDCDESEPGAAEHTSAPARGITDVLNKRAKVHHSDGQDVASHRTGISSSSDVTAAYFLTYRMLCKFPESQVVSFLRRMKQLERVGHVAKIEGKKSSQDLQEFSSDEEILCNVPESCHDPDSGDKNTWLHHDVRTILEQGASKSSHRQHASRQSYIEPKLVPIPTIIKHLEPQLSVAAFNKIMATDDFNNKRVRICRICHARYSSFVLSSRIERINELVATSKGMNSALKLPLANIRSHAPSASLSARAHAPAPKASIRPALSQRSEFSARQQNIDALRCNGQTVRGVRLMLNELHVPFDESSQSSSASYSDDFDEDSESSLNEDGIDSEVKPLHVALPAVRHLFRHMSGSEWPQASDHAVNSSLATGSRDTDQSLTFAKWMNFCKTFSVTERLPVQKQDCIDCFKDANLGSLQRSMSLLQFSACLLHMAVKSGILSHSDIRPSILDKNMGLQTLAAKPNDFSSRISSAIELIKSKRDGPSVSSALASLFPSQDENVSNSARSVMATQRSRTIDLIAVKSTGRTISSDQQPQPLPSVQTAFKDKEKFTVESKSAMRDKLYSGKAHLRRLRYNSAVCCPNVLRGIAQLLRMLHIVGTDTSAYCDTVQMNVYESPPLWRLQPVFCKLFQDASMSSHNMISNMGSRQKTLNLGEWSVWCSERKVCDHLNMRKSDAISCFLMAGGNVTGCEVDLEGFCACFIQMAVLAGFLRADQLIDFINPLVESDVSRTNAQFGIDISPSRDRHLVGTESDPRSGALWDRLPAIRVWFKQAASEGGVSFGNRGNLVSLQEWQSFCRKIGFASLGLSRSDLTYAFVNGFSPDNSESSVRQDIYEARISEFSQSIILIAVRARFIVVEPCCSAPSAINCDENTLENVRRMFARLSIPVSGAGLPLISSDSESLQLPKKSVFHMHFKQYLSRTFDSRDQCSLDQLSFSLPDMLPCLGKTFNDLSCQMPPVSVSLMSPAAGFETTQFWIKFCLQSLAADVLHLKLVDAVTCVIAADPAASQYRRSQPMTLELFSQCLLHLAQRSKFLLKQDADALPRATKCSGCSILAVAFMLISLKQAPEALSTETYLKILAANASAGIDPVNSNDNLTIVAPKNTQEVLDKLLQQQPSTTAWPAEDRHDIKVALQKEEDHHERANMLAEVGWACGMTGDRRSAMQSANPLPRALRVFSVFLLAHAPGRFYRLAVVTQHESGDTDPAGQAGLRGHLNTPSVSASRPQPSPPENERAFYGDDHDVQKTNVFLLSNASSGAFHHRGRKLISSRPPK